MCEQNSGTYSFQWAWKILSQQTFFFIFEAAAPPVGHGLLIHEISRSHTHTQWRKTVGRTPLDEWSALPRDLYLTTRNTQQQTDIHAPGGIRPRNPSKQAAADVRLTPRGHRDRLLAISLQVNTLSGRWSVDWFMKSTERGEPYCRRGKDISHFLPCMDRCRADWISAQKVEEILGLPTPNKAQGGSRGIAPLILKLGTVWSGNGRIQYPAALPPREQLPACSG